MLFILSLLIKARHYQSGLVKVPAQSRGAATGVGKVTEMWPLPFIASLQSSNRFSAVEISKALIAL